jgi:hypothetical protein
LIIPGTEKYYFEVKGSVTSFIGLIGFVTLSEVRASRVVSVVAIRAGSAVSLALKLRSNLEVELTHHYHRNITMSIKTIVFCFFKTSSGILVTV